MIENWNRILAGPVNTTNFLWKEGEEEGEEEQEEEQDEVEIFEESEETEGSEEWEAATTSLAETTLKFTMYLRQPPPLFPPINFSPPGPLTEEEKDLIENWNRILAGPVNNTNFLWKEGEKEGEEEQEEVEIFEESEETERSAEWEAATTSLTETTLKFTMYLRLLPDLHNQLSTA